MFEYLTSGSIATVLAMLLIAPSRKYIKTLFWPNANIAKTDFFKRVNANGKNKAVTESSNATIDIFKEKISQVPIFIPGKGARNYKSTYSGKSFLKDEHEKQKRLFCSTDVAGLLHSPIITV